jgi:hypothetical protein
MAATIVGLHSTALLSTGRLVAQPAAAAGFTAGRLYLPLALAVDTTPPTGTPVLYVITADDAGHVVYSRADGFVFQVPA